MNGRRTRACMKSVSYADTSLLESENIEGEMNTPLPAQFSATELAQMLEELQKEIPNVTESDMVGMELKGFNVKDVTTYEEYCRMKKNILEKNGFGENFDDGGRTSLNVGAAAIAGAKMVIDNARSTRAFSKKLIASSGVSDGDILYKGLSLSGPEGAAAKATAVERKASLVESLVDFQKQIQFKLSVLNHIDKAANGISKSDGPVTRRGKNEEDKTENTMKKAQKRKNAVCDPLKTPKQKHELNPLDDKRIYEEHAHNIASVLREDTKKRRRTAPIPFNLNLLDEAEE